MSALRGSRIAGVGGYRPERVVANAELAAMTSVSARWMEERTGIRQRHYAGTGETVVSMAIAAGTAAIKAADLVPDDVDLVVLATSSREQLAPAGAPQVASGLGTRGAAAFDLNAVCAGFTFGLSMASNAVRTGQAENVLVVGSDKLSPMIGPELPDTFAIFADGAGAAVVSAAATEDIGQAVWGSDGTRAAVIESKLRPDGRVRATMDGPVVYRWATGEMPAVAKAACARYGVSPSDIAWFVPHQANRRIIDTVARTLAIPPERVVLDIVETGNTSSASIPLALTRLRDSGRSTPGELVLLLGFGSGLSHAGMVARMC
ncbi:3-oxoacyl-[acyl-carrier-protein] synthase-3 [Saccharothrix coeruleofusca]|uniref:beta-ketoacyl-ACP synthase 3 n=1 Tax=Saccharothrix coeruleofusca TaxID=33919 RepID=UPI001AE6DA41|nr:beta-ketoacyl-ACP synthase 3 [Saccharothrix coeruleofusca]MBP2336781.1 3-oxoacyl-[acyl-carrier-protein] synthase-3 [Saccharothrix coeruleofusca]